MEEIRRPETRLVYDESLDASVYIPFEIFDSFLVEIMSELSPDDLLKQVPGVYTAVCAHFKDEVRRRWKQDTNRIVEEEPFEEPSSSIRVLCQVCEEPLRDGTCKTHPYAGTKEE